MHESMQRVYAAARERQEVQGPSALGRLLNKSPQTITNWEARGISAAGAIEAGHVLGVSSAWIQHGIEPRVQPPITGRAAGTLGEISAGDEGGGARILKASDALAARHQSPLTLERALPVVLDALADLPPARAASVRALLDLVRDRPEMKGDVLAELLNLLTEPSKGRIAA